jgi:cellulose synthase/poly-beta-1,6-N-acetylglucosamine synthase-like glycosyltransferase
MSVALLAGGTALCALGILCLLLAVHPFTTYPLSLRILPRRPLRPAQPGTRPLRAALCVCAYNEERVIRAKAENMVAMREAMPNLDLFIYVDAASDGTAAILREFEPAIRVVESPTRCGKTHGMNTLVAMAASDVVVFSDANVIFAPDAIPRLLAPFADPAVGAVCGHLRYTGPDGSATAAAGSLYWRLEEHIKSLESRTGSCMGADGSIFAIRRALHQPPPDDLIDDMYVSLAILCAGWRVVRAETAHASEASVSRPGEEFRRKIRIGCQAFNVHRVLWPRLRRLSAIDLYKYVSHKLLRWLTIHLLGFGILALLDGIVLLNPAAAVAASFIALAALGGIFLSRSGKIAKVLQDVLLAFLATGLGVWRSVQGDRFQTWNPPDSARMTLVGSGEPR